MFKGLQSKFFSGKSPSDDGESASADDITVDTAPSSAPAPSQPSPSYLSFRKSKQNDQKMETAVKGAARQLGDGVQEVVLKARAKDANDKEWKDELLALLAPEDSNVDVLLRNSACEKFVLRCVENELPPNLIYCLRLLRVLELQHASEGEVDVQPIADDAARKVASLLGLLCKDPVVGEQLRPHLFSLLALSGASYPPSAVHLAQAASDVICAFAGGCLTRELIAFIHGRKMVLHMTDDVKELVGMVDNSNQVTTSVANGLVGAEANNAGLWYISLRTLVQFIAASCDFGTVELLKDFEAAGGFKVLRHAITTSRNEKFGNKMIQLLPVLASCPNEAEEKRGDETLKSAATNKNALEIMDDLLHKSNPLLRAFREQQAERPNLDVEGSLQIMASLSLQTAIEIRSKMQDDALQGGLGFDVGMELLDSTLGIFSDHPDNFDTVEGRLHILSFSILAYPCYEDEELKSFILKMLEFVLTGVGIGDEVTSVHATVEIFFEVCQSLLKGDTLQGKEHVALLLAKDLQAMGASLEKLLQFDQRVAPLMIDSGILTTSLDGLLDLIAHRREGTQSPPLSTNIDATFVTVCGVLKLLVSHQPSDVTSKANVDALNDEMTNLHRLLRMGTKELGPDACVAASSVFEAFLSAFASIDGLTNDIKFVLGLLEHLSSISETNSSIIQRQCVLLAMVRSVIEARNLARDAFREAGGFQGIITLVLAYRGRMRGVAEDESSVWWLKLIQGVFALLDALVGSKSRSLLANTDTTPLFLPYDVNVDPVSSQVSHQSPASRNCNYMRRTRFYLDLAASISESGALNSQELSERIISLSLAHMEPTLETTTLPSLPDTLRNPDAVRLVLGLCHFASRSHSTQLIMSTLEVLQRLSRSPVESNALLQLACCGLAASLTDPLEFGPLLFCNESLVQSHLAALLREVASFRTSYFDFVSLLRSVAGPSLAALDSKGEQTLPVISSSFSRRSSQNTKRPDLSRDKESTLKERLELLRDIAMRGTAVPCMTVGGDSINTIGVLMHQVKLEERLRAVSNEGGRLKYIEIDRLDASSFQHDGASTKDSKNSKDEKVWSPLQGSGFTLSLWLRLPSPEEIATDNAYLIDMCDPNFSTDTNQNACFLSVWYDLQQQRVNVISSSSYRMEPTCFPVSPLVPGVWHHVMLTYTPSKRSVIQRKPVFSLYIDGRPSEADVRVDSVSLPSSARVVLGAPNPVLAASGIVRGKVAEWELGPFIMLSTVLLDLDAAALFAYGPAFPGLLWGDRPQRLSLTATSTMLFSTLADTGEMGSIATLLRRRSLEKLEGVGYAVSSHVDNDDLSFANLRCQIPPECIIFAFQASTGTQKLRNGPMLASGSKNSKRIINLAHSAFGSEHVSTDALLVGRQNTSMPSGFADSLQWVGGPLLLMPLVYSAATATALDLALHILRLSVHRHLPNLESMQVKGGYKILAVLLQEKAIADERCLDQCLAMAVHGFDTRPPSSEQLNTSGSALPYDVAAASLPPERWILVDVDALKHLILNRQVWDLKRYGPALQIRIVSALNRLVDRRSDHKAFNSRRLHLVGIVRWALHLMIEASDLYAGSVKPASSDATDSWTCEAALVDEAAVGGEPGNPFLKECKSLLRNVLTFMLTPGDLEKIASALVYTVSAKNNEAADAPFVRDEKLLPFPTMRLHLVRLLEELIVDGVNEIVRGKHDTAKSQHIGGVASPNQPYLSTAGSRGKDEHGKHHPKHQQVQAFLSAFSSFLTPSWFATLMEGCGDEATATASLRLLTVMLQASYSFESAFYQSGAFAPFIASVPRYSNCPGIILCLLSLLLNVPLLHLHALPALEADQLCEVFDSEARDGEGILVLDSHDPSSGVFALLAECLGRNAQVAVSEDNDSSRAHAMGTNEAIFKLLSHRMMVSPSFQEYCSSVAFTEPLCQALCLSYNVSQSRMRSRRARRLSDVPKNITPTERFIGAADSEAATLGMINLVESVISRSVATRRGAAFTVRDILRSIPLHAAPEQVEAFHLMLIEGCKTIVGLKKNSSEALVLANCIGVVSALLDLAIAGMFTPEAVLESTRLSLEVLETLVSSDGGPITSLAYNEQQVLVLDAAHLTRLLCSTGLRIGVAATSVDGGDEDLQSEILRLIESHFPALFLLQSRDRKSSRKLPTGNLPKPSPGNRLYPVWESTSVARLMEREVALYPDLKDCENSEVTAIAPMLVSLYNLLVQSREDVRGNAIDVLVLLLQHCPKPLGELLVAEVINESGEKETLDVVNRGGFRALLAAHEAASASISDNTSASSSVKRRYASFFEWFDKNQSQVAQIFTIVDEHSNSLFPDLVRCVTSQQDAVEMEQQMILQKMTRNTQTDRAILGGFERMELSRQAAERTMDDHSEWKRHGFDDLAAGASRWKTLLRQLKGTYSIWEGSPRNFASFCLTSSDVLERDGADALKGDNPDRRWKLDLTEGYERQRRRLLPNYEFHALYNLEEDTDAAPEATAPTAVEESADIQVEATAELLKDLNLKRTHRNIEDDLDMAEEEVEEATVASTNSDSGMNEDAQAVASEDAKEAQSSSDQSPQPDTQAQIEDSSTYELISGLLSPGDRPEKCYNIKRCTGLEVNQGILLWCSDAIYVIDGFEQKGDGVDGTIARVERQQSSFSVNLRPKGFVRREENEEVAVEALKNKKKNSAAKSSAGDSTTDVVYQHRSQRLPFSDLYSVFRRRYQLQQSALEFFDVNNSAMLLAFESPQLREEVLTKVVQSNLPNSVFNSIYGSFVSYTKFMKNFQQKVISDWSNGKMTNFDFLMHMNSFAGRTFNDLTQYPVFPWIIADYESEKLDLDDPKTYRDLSKPMGGIGEARAKQFRERYEALASTSFGEDDPPPFHYGTHYSSAAYVLYYLIRLEPFSRLALALQGGKFDVADRLFHDLGKSWKSASAENLQDVRELIPEFFYLPDFLENKNHFDYGETQRGKSVHDVTLPKWAGGDPKKFVRINRQALESDYVSRHLHQWADLIFGFKQRGEEAIEAMNTFVHVTYEGEVDIDSMEDEVERNSVIAQIQNFGQTPSRLERNPFPQRKVPDVMTDKGIDFGALSIRAPLTPPLCVTGAPHRIKLRSIATDTCRTGLKGQRSHAVGDICYSKGQLIGVGRQCTLVIPSKKYFRFGSVSCGVSSYTAAVTAKFRETDKLLSTHDALHRAPITVARCPPNGRWLVTGCVDSTVRVWKYSGTSLLLQSTICGHDGWNIKDIDVSTEFGVIATACAKGRILMWDLRSLTYVRALLDENAMGSFVGVSINHRTGSVLTCIGPKLRLFDINGGLIASTDAFPSDPPTSIVATNCPEWMEKGVVAVTGHRSGEVRLWSLRYDRAELFLRHSIEENHHTSEITVLKVTGVENDDVLLVGDSSGRMSAYKTAHLDTFEGNELREVAAELSQGLTNLY